MKKLVQKRIDMYDIGDGLTLLNVINKNEDGKMRQITTYIGIEGNGFVCVGKTDELDAPGAIFSYRSYVRVMILATSGQHSYNTRTNIPATSGQTFLNYSDTHS